MDAKKELDIGWALDPGIKRKGRPNQDAIRIVLPNLINKKPPLFILADGMGGYSGGAIASKFVIKSIAKNYIKKNEKDRQKTLHYLVSAAHQELVRYANKNPNLSKMGSTVVLGIIERQKLYFGNVGDSRIYLINVQNVQQLSMDHSLVGEQVRAGAMTSVEALNHPHKNRLTMSINARRPSIKPYIGACEFNNNDVLVLCSDGLWNTISNAQLQSIVLQLHPQQAANKIIETANSNQGPDNISVIIVRRKDFEFKDEDDDDTVS